MLRNGIRNCYQAVGMGSELGVCPHFNWTFAHYQYWTSRWRERVRERKGEKESERKREREMGSKQLKINRVLQSSCADCVLRMALGKLFRKKKRLKHFVDNIRRQRHECVSLLSLCGPTHAHFCGSINMMLAALTLSHSHSSQFDNMRNIGMCGVILYIRICIYVKCSVDGWTCVR